MLYIYITAKDDRNYSFQKDFKKYALWKISERNATVFIQKTGFGGNSVKDNWISLVKKIFSQRIFLTNSKVIHNLLNKYTNFEKDRNKSSCTLSSLL